MCIFNNLEKHLKNQEKILKKTSGNPEGFHKLKKTMITKDNSVKQFEFY